VPEVPTSLTTRYTLHTANFFKYIRIFTSKRTIHSYETWQICSRVFTGNVADHLLKYLETVENDTNTPRNCGRRSKNTHKTVADDPQNVQKLWQTI